MRSSSSGTCRDGVSHTHTHTGEEDEGEKRIQVLGRKCTRGDEQGGYIHVRHQHNDNRAESRTIALIGRKESHVAPELLKISIPNFSPLFFLLQRVCLVSALVPKGTYLADKRREIQPRRTRAT
jgi:hypothetical protein